MSLQLQRHGAIRRPWTSSRATGVYPTLPHTPKRDPELAAKLISRFHANVQIEPYGPEEFPMRSKPDDESIELFIREVVTTMRNLRCELHDLMVAGWFRSPRFPIIIKDHRDLYHKGMFETKLALEARKKMIIWARDIGIQHLKATCPDIFDYLKMKHKLYSSKILKNKLGVVTRQSMMRSTRLENAAALMDQHRALQALSFHPVVWNPWGLCNFTQYRGVVVIPKIGPNDMKKTADGVYMIKAKFVLENFTDKRPIEMTVRRTDKFNFGRTNSTWEDIEPAHCYNTNEDPDDSNDDDDINRAFRGKGNRIGDLRIVLTDEVLAAEFYGAGLRKM